MMLVTITHAPGATTPDACADAVPILVAEVDRPTVERILAAVAEAIAARVTADALVEEWEPDGPPCFRLWEEVAAALGGEDGPA